ncbi:DMT family transporter [Rhizobium leguminosarum]|uniref:DMT family transporter n=1 Tax=Rhizobium leguminosarum TaxID=384 RepID=UPI001C940AD4|nr:DMT family transporter [Rhizobium leguminosarum]MBY5361914.1 DMT family transporter [Rhizobium leguminosarum]MBY5664944.1 DMT family transporter [Rhizobium leguminosarum]MBY5677572.1 DMT family transporter [Rhizobium leguminosarum]
MYGSFAKRSSFIVALVTRPASGVLANVAIGSLALTSNTMFAIASTYGVIACGLMLFVPWRHWLPQLLRNKGLYLVRATALFAATATYTASLTAMPLATCVAAAQATPLFVVLGARLALGEEVRRRDWFFFIFCAAAILAILSPWSGVNQILPTMLLISSTILSAVSTVLTKKLSMSLGATSGAIPSMIIMASLLVVPGYLWRPEYLQIGDYCLIGLSAGLLATSELGLAVLLSRFPTPFVISFHFLRLPWAVVVGILMLGQVPSMREAIGMLFLCALLAAYIAPPSLSPSFVKRSES